jgi:hypothetical protein
LIAVVVRSGAISDNLSRGERRAVARHLKGLVQIEFASGFQKENGFAELHDLSVLGIGLWGNQKLDPGTTIEILLPQTKWSRAGILPAVVRHATTTPDGIWLLGCKFSRLVTPEDFKALDSSPLKWK